jgi:hypothetical protein
MLGGFFNEPLEGVNFPLSLPTFDFGYEINQPLLRVAFDAFLETSMFGGSFNEPLEGVDFRASLLTLAFGCEFNQLAGNQFVTIRAIARATRNRCTLARTTTLHILLNAACA